MVDTEIVEKVIFVSDLHLVDAQDERSQKFTKLLQGWRGTDDISHLVLLGDVFDLWVADHAYFVEKFDSIVSEIKRLVECGVKVSYFEGNHDLYLEDFWQKQLGVDIYGGPHSFEMFGLRVRAEHGDQVNPDDKGYQFLRWFLRTSFMSWFCKNMPEKIILKIGEEASKKSRHYTSTIKSISDNANREVLRKYAAALGQKGEVDLLVTGHLHIIDDIQIPVSDGLHIRSINLGTWLYQPCYLELTKGSIKVVNI